MKLFLDDIRQPQECIHYMQKRIGALNPIYLEDWTVVRNYKDFVDAVTNHIDEITHVSFDHDLADIHYDPTTWREGFVYQEETGHDCAVWLKDFYKEKGKELPILFVHSMNPVGTQNIINVFK
jgi:hypothetical protein